MSTVLDRRFMITNVPSSTMGSNLKSIQEMELTDMVGYFDNANQNYMDT
eukprot:UN17443